MNNGVRRTLNSLKCFADYMISRLCENLNGNVIGDKTVVYKTAHKCIFGFRGGREADLYLFKSYINKKLKKFKLFFKAHRLNKSLVTVAQVNTAPCGGSCDMILFHPVICDCRRHKILRFILLKIFHNDNTSQSK